MDPSVMISLINNAAILLVLSVVFEIAYHVPIKYRRFQPIISGFMIATICIVVMNVPFTFQPGIIYDTRSILISVTALIFGFVPTAITVAAAVVFRISLGGAGTLQGLAVIFTSALIGLIWRRWVYPRSIKRKRLSVYLMSLTVHALMLLYTLLIPYPQNLIVLRVIAIPVILIYPVASVILSLLLLRQQEFKAIQAQLLQSEARFKSLFEKAPLGYQSLDSNGYFLEVNQQWLDTLGYTRDEVIGKWFGDFLAPSCRDTFRQRFPLFKNQGKIHSEFEMIHKRGHFVFIAFEGRVSYGIGGEFVQTHCILQDITKQRISEAELRASEEKYRRLFETMTQGVIYQSTDGAVLSANPAAERILGQTYEEILSRTYLDSGWKAIKENGMPLTEAEHPITIALQTGKPFGPFVFGVFQPQLNDHVWLSINTIPLFRQGENKPHQVYSIFQDITAERKANQNYEQLFNEMVDGFALHEILCDPKGVPIDYRFLKVNPAFERMTGLKAEDILGKTVLEILPETEPYWIETYGKVAQTGEPIRFENYAGAMNQFYEVSAYRPSYNQFACTFSDVTKRVNAEEETRRILSRLRSLLNNSPSPIVIIDQQARIIEISTVARKILGLPESDLSDDNPTEIAPPLISEKVAYVMTHMPDENALLEGVDVFTYQGDRHYFESLLFAMHTPGQQEKLYGYLAIDVTARIAAEDALKQSELKYSSYIENAPYAVFVVDDNGHYLEANHASTLMTGYTRDQLLHMSIADITAPEAMEAALRHFQSLKSSGAMSGELQFVHRDGSTRWWVVDAVKLSDTQYLGFSSDITERKAAEAELLYISYHDFLTGLYNRRYYEAELKRVDCPEKLPLSIMVGDINGVKLINDAFGHAEGDRLIMDCAAIIKSCCRERDTVARIGGDEFAILMPNTDGASAMAVMNQIKARLKAFDEDVDKGRFTHSVSMGYGTKKTDDEDIHQILKIAEEYMYQHKLLEHASSHSSIIASIKATMVEKSHETEEHAERLVDLSRMIAKAMNLSQIDQDRLELLATLHDIGKVGISDRILTKQASLDETEWVEMKRHPEIGYRIAISSPELIPVAESILCHHERWDGSGYPQGLSGETIPLISRILAVVDAYDAMTQDRPYRKAITHEEAMAEIVKHAGTQFDPNIVNIFQTIMAGAQASPVRSPQ